MLTASPSRREFLFNGAMGLGTVALSALMAEQQARAGALEPKSRTTPQKRSDAFSC
jgi:hypothetical protein